MEQVFMPLVQDATLLSGGMVYLKLETILLALVKAKSP